MVLPREKKMRNQKNILLVETNSMLRQSLFEQLEVQDRIWPLAAATVSEGLEAIQELNFDLLILDGATFKTDGLRLCRTIRLQNPEIPIIILAQGTAIDKELNIDSEATDYITKPFFFRALMERVRHNLRTTENTEDTVYSFGPYQLDSNAQLLIGLAEEKKIRLTEKETSILKYLARHANSHVARKDLLNEIWEYSSEITTHTLETHIYKLRQKLESDPSNAKILVTEPGGYRLNS